MNAGKWFAVYTSPRWEKRVTELLAKKKIETYCPINKIPRFWSDRKKIVGEPLFTSYVFVFASESDYQVILQTSGVLSFVYWLGRPAEIRNEEIDSIKRFLNEYPQVRLEKTRVNHGEQVRIISDSLMHRKGNILEVRNNTAKIMLPSLGYSLIAPELEERKENTEIISYIQDSRVNF